MASKMPVFETGNMFEIAEKQGLFDDFEVNGQPFWPRIAKLVGGSVVFHGIMVACVIFIPPVRNALSIAAMFADAGFVDRPYAKTHIADEAELLAMTTDRFRYPEGYWAIDQGASVLPLPTPSPFPLQPLTLMKPPRVRTTPSPTPFPIASPSPLIAAKTAGNGADKTNQAKTEDKKDDDKVDEKAQQNLKAANEAGIEMPVEGEINKQPFKDLATYVDNLKNQGKLDLDQPFEVVIETQLDENGKLVDEHVARKAGDAQLVELSKDLVAKMNDSGILFYLKALNKDNPNTKVVFTIKQDKNEIVASVTADAKSPESAEILVKGFNAALAFGVINRKGKDEEPLLRSTSTSQEGNKIIFNFKMPREAVVDIIKKGIASASPTATPS
jgi:hypothetical protein